MRIPKRMRSLFWDTTLARVDADRDAAFVLERVLEFGRMADVRWAIKSYGLPHIHRFLAEAQKLVRSE